MIEAYRHLIENAYCAGFFDGDCSLASAEKYADNILEEYEKPFRVKFVPSTQYFKTLEGAKNSKFYGSTADIECLCVNGEWVKIA